jgi:CBS domain-containing protein
VEVNKDHDLIDDGGTSDDDRQPDDAGERGTLGDEDHEPRPLPPRVSGSPRALLDLRTPPADPPAERSPGRAGHDQQEDDREEPVHTVRDIMTPTPITLPLSATVADAARQMRDADVGDVLVVQDGELRGLVTDRDIVVRGLATGLDGTTPIGELCSPQLLTVSPDEPTEVAADLMASGAVRRLPVVESGRPVGIVALGDLAVRRDPGSALGSISSAPPNR